MVFDPAKTSYDEMLRLFWENHDPTQGMRQGNDVGTQYRSAIYWDTDEHRRARRGLARDVSTSACANRATRRSPPRSPRPARSTTPRTTTSSTWTRTRGATAAWAAPASAARSAPASRPRPTWRAATLACSSRPGTRSRATARTGSSSSSGSWTPEGLEEIRRHFMAVFEHEWETGLAPDEVNYTPGVTAGRSHAADVQRLEGRPRAGRRDPVAPGRASSPRGWPGCPARAWPRTTRSGSRRRARRCSATRTRPTWTTSTRPT